MHLLRRAPDLSGAHVRLATTADLSRIARFLRDAGHRYYGLQGTEFAQLLTKVPTVIYETHLDILAVAISGWQSQHATWLRGLALVRGLDISQGIDAVLPTLHETLLQSGLQRIFYVGDDTADTWLVPALRACGYVKDTTVIVYEKHDLEIPPLHTEAMLVRPAVPMDLPAIVELDEVCFEAHWTKNHLALNSAILEGMCFVVAVLDSQIVGYAYATSHFGGRLVHLVRLAVNPYQRRQGIGARLLAEVIMFARQQHADMMTLNTQSYNEHAQRLYRWFGFVPNGEYQNVFRYDLGDTPTPYSHQ
jgi:ribosomal protein S18 acetylase RimI-like enzyme